MKHQLYKNVVIKVGTNVLTKENGLLDTETMGHLVAQISELKEKGINIILVSSGAVAAGRSLVTLSEKTHPVETRQVLSSIGQVRLINTYAHLFEKHNFLCAQVLVTKGDFRDRRHYLNMKTCFTSLLNQNIIPVVNENDVVSVTELMFTDNDELSGLIASMMQSQAMIILTNVDGIYDGPIKDPASKVISVIDSKDTDFKKYIAPQKSSFGRGGMLTKSSIAHHLSSVGIAVHIANGKRKNVLHEIFSGASVGTTFLPQKKASSVKRWIAHSEGYEKGLVVINAGAEAVLTSGEKASSLLPVGVTAIEGSFKKGDVIKICDENKKVLGYGVAQYGSDKAQELAGKKGQKPLVHYDYLFLKQ